MIVETVTFADSYKEAMPLTVKHWDEVPFGPWKDIGLDVNTENYLLAEQEGYLRVLIVRDEGKLVGYVILLTSEMNHHKGVWQAVTDVIYVDPEYRGKGVAKMLFEACTLECKNNGISFFSVVVNPNLDFSSMLEKMSAKLTDKIYTWRV